MASRRVRHGDVRRSRDPGCRSLFAPRKRPPSSSWECPTCRWLKTRRAAGETDRPDPWVDYPVAQAMPLRLKAVGEELAPP